MPLRRKRELLVESPLDSYLSMSSATRSFHFDRYAAVICTTGLLTKRNRPEMLRNRPESGYERSSSAPIVMIVPISRRANVTLSANGAAFVAPIPAASAMRAIIGMSQLYSPAICSARLRCWL